MGEHVEIYCMMKQDSFYDKDAVRRHGLSGLDDERCYHDLLRYAIMLDNAIYWLKKLEKSERKDLETKRARERASFREVVNKLERANYTTFEDMKEDEVGNTK